jgi:two-component system, NarL family, sensor histidine kinase DesK
MIRKWLEPAPDAIAARHVAEGKLVAMMMLNLVWAIWVFGDLLFQREISREWVIATAVSFPIFLVLYLAAYVRPVRHIIWYAGSMALLGYVVMLWNSSGGCCYVIFACAYLAFYGSPKHCVILMAGAVGTFVIEALLLQWPTSVLLTMSFVAFSVGFGNLMYRMNSQKDAELKLSYEEVKRLATTAERERIGRDLHDLLGHTLSLITLKLELSRRLFDRDIEAARREVADAELVARHALAEVRAAVTGIRATGLAGELVSAKLLLNSSSVHFEYPAELPELPAPLDAGLALVLREAVTNIHRHAQATRAEASIHLEAGALTMTISDNGRGGEGGEGNGLCGMRERVRAMSGRLDIESSRGHGTRLLVVVPVLAKRPVLLKSDTPADQTVSPDHAERRAL